MSNSKSLLSCIENVKVLKDKAKPGFRSNVRVRAHLRADPQAPLEALLVFGHAQGEVAVPAVHRADPALQLRHVRVAFLHQVVRQLDQQLHLLLGLLRDRQSEVTYCQTGGVTDVLCPDTV